MKYYYMLAAAALMLMGASCSSYEEDDVFSTRRVYSLEAQQTLDSFYTFCIDVWGDEIPQNIKDNEVLVIRFCEKTFDPYGDILVEMDGYELIQDILWPNGYGNPA